MGFAKGEEHIFRYQYDFDESGGAASTIDLVLQGNNALESGLVILDWTIKVITALASSGSATVTMGNEDDTDGYAADFFSSGSAGAILNLGDRAGALVWDDTNDHRIHYVIPDAGAAVPSITIGTAALTAGKFDVYFKCFKPV